MRWFVTPRRNRSTRLASGTTIFLKPPTTRFATCWSGPARNTATAHLPVGSFGASTGAAAALVAAAERPDDVRAVVSRGGRPDLAIPVLNRVKAPTLLIVGGEDVAVIEMNRESLKHLKV